MKHDDWGLHSARSPGNDQLGEQFSQSFDKVACFDKVFRIVGKL